MISVMMPTKMVNNMGKDKRTVQTIYETPLFLILRKHGFILKAINPFVCGTLSSSFSVDINGLVVFLIVENFKALPEIQRKNGIVKLKLPL